jgi:hypothetical protein
VAASLALLPPRSRAQLDHCLLLVVQAALRFFVGEPERGGIGSEDAIGVARADLACVIWPLSADVACHLAGYAAEFLGLEELRTVAQIGLPTEDRAQRPFIDPPRDFGEAVAVRLDDEERTA